MDGGHVMGPFDGGWIGMVSEFRNQLSIFLAGTNELFAMLPPAVAAQFADTLDDMESSAKFLQTLLTWMDASVGQGKQTIADVADLLLRAKALASTGLSPRVSVRLEPRPAGVRNRGAAIECALAALITELGRASDPGSAGDIGSSDGFDVSVSVHPRRGTLSIVLASGGSQPGAGGWRVSLAKTLAGSGRWHRGAAGSQRGEQLLRTNRRFRSAVPFSVTRRFGPACPDGSAEARAPASTSAPAWFQNRNRLHRCRRLREAPNYASPTRETET